MKTISILALCLAFTKLLSQEITEKEVETRIDNVTIFIEGAQIVRKKHVNLAKGTTTLKYINLSPFIDHKSVQVKAEGGITILSVNHQQNYLDKLQKPKELLDMENRLEEIENKVKIEYTHLSVIKEELAFLHENRNIGGKNEQISVTNLQQTSKFYNEKLTSLKLSEIEHNKTIKELNNQRTDLQNQIRALTVQKKIPAGEILVKVDTKKTGIFSFEISYIVDNAGWFPSYDIRAKNISEPIQLIYKANVKQNTKVDWKNVKLKLSSANPNVSGVAPELKTHFLGYNTLPPTYKPGANNVSGKVTDNYGEPLPGATVVVHGTTIGTTTDQGGDYTITIPNHTIQLTYSCIGFNPQTLPISGAVMNVALDGRNRHTATLKMKKEYMEPLHAVDSSAESETKLQSVSSSAIPTAQVEKQTTVDFEIKTPYTIASDNKNYTVDMEFYNLPAFYQYYCVPKIDKNAFLIANITDWEQYSLLEGEANLFFEDTYIGKALLDVRYASDTLGISLGRDKKVSVNREKIKEFTNKQSIGSKKEDSMAWKITVRNSKSQKIDMIILDQVPVSTTKEIEVKIQNLSNAKHDPETGKIKWEFNLNPNDKKEFDLRYSVKYPKNRNLIIE